LKSEISSHSASLVSPTISKTSSSGSEVSETSSDAIGSEKPGICDLDSEGQSSKGEGKGRRKRKKKYEIPEDELESKTHALSEMGFRDNERNLDLLKRFRGNLNSVVQTLLSEQRIPDTKDEDKSEGRTRKRHLDEKNKSNVEKSKKPPRKILKKEKLSNNKKKELENRKKNGKKIKGKGKKKSKEEIIEKIKRELEEGEISENDSNTQTEEEDNSSSNSHNNLKKNRSH